MLCLKLHYWAITYKPAFRLQKYWAKKYQSEPFHMRCYSQSMYESFDMLKKKNKQQNTLGVKGFPW